MTNPSPVRRLGTLLARASNAFPTTLLLLAKGGSYTTKGVKRIRKKIAKQKMLLTNLILAILMMINRTTRKKTYNDNIPLKLLELLEWRTTLNCICVFMWFLAVHQMSFCDFQAKKTEK